MGPGTDDTIDATGDGASEGASSATAGSGSGPRTRPRLEPEPGSLVGRYVVLSKLGAGAMGVVLAAYDPELDRKVAVKVLKARKGRKAEDAQARLQREAQALARLNDSHVVAVHDVGLHDGHVFVAMEFVEGQTLGDWMTSAGPGPRHWREVLEVFVAAGLGLAAAHREGLIHRDFKPDNVMIGSDGRVRVMDFGLARTDEARSQEDAASTAPASALQPREPDLGIDDSALSTPLTQTGALMGTPAYMAPEQFVGRVSARSDQFGYCVALFEALYGVRPFRGDTLAQLAFAVTHGKIKDPPGGTSVPRWLAVAVRRGLSADPQRRFDDMVALVAALRAGEGRRRRSFLVSSVGVAGVIAVATLGVAKWHERSQIARCVAEGESIRELWNDETTDRLRAGLVATKVSYAASSAERAIHFFDAQAQAIANAETDLCLTSEVRKEWSQELADRSRWCLGERRLELAALVEEFSNTDEHGVRRVAEAASQLTAVGPCGDADRLMNEPPPPENREAVTELRRRLSKSVALNLAGEYASALEVAKETLEAVRSEEAPLLGAEASLRVGTLLLATGEFEQSKVALEDAYFAASRMGAAGLAADAAITLTHLEGHRLARRNSGLRWARHANLALDLSLEPDVSLRRATLAAYLGLLAEDAGNNEEARAHYDRALTMSLEILEPDHPMVAGRLTDIAAIEVATGNYAEALAIQERVLETWEATLGPKHPRVAISLTNVALTRRDMGFHEEARKANERALAIFEEAFGPDHYEVARVLNNLALSHKDAGDFEKARTLHERALAIREKVLEPNHPDIASSLNNLAIILRNQRDFEGAKVHYERAIEIWEAAFGPEHAKVAAGLNNLAAVYQSTKQPLEAKKHYERALGILTKSLGAEHPNVAFTLANLAQIALNEGDHEGARVGYERAAEVLEKALGPDHPSVARALAGLVEVALAQGRAGDAIELATRALDIRVSAEIDPVLIAQSKVLLVQALWRAPASGGRDRPRARELATQALETFRESQEHGDGVAELEAWLAKLPR